MAKSLRSKREKRLRAIRREIVEPFYDKKEAAKLAAQEAALAAPKLPIPPQSNAAMDASTSANNTNMGITSPLFLYSFPMLYCLCELCWLLWICSNHMLVLQNKRMLIYFYICHNAQSENDLKTIFDFVVPVCPVSVSLELSL